MDQMIILAVIAIGSWIWSAISKAKEADTASGGGESRASGSTKRASGDAPDRGSVQNRLRELAEKRRAEMQRMSEKRRSGDRSSQTVSGATGAPNLVAEQRQREARKRAEAAKAQREAARASARARADRELTGNAGSRQRMATIDQKRRAERAQREAAARKAEQKQQEAEAAKRLSEAAKAKAKARAKSRVLNERDITLVGKDGRSSGVSGVKGVADPLNASSLRSLLGSREGLRQAIVLQELMGAPVSMREGMGPMDRTS